MQNSVIASKPNNRKQHCINKAWALHFTSHSHHTSLACLLSLYYTDASDNRSRDSEAPSPRVGEDVQQDIIQQLQRHYMTIGRQYAAYVSCICTSLKEKHVNPRDLSTFLLKLPALRVDTDDGQYRLLAGLRAQFQRAETINDIIDAMDFSFLEYHVFQDIVERYRLDENQATVMDPLRLYPDRLKEYIEKHKISEFIQINPQLSTLDSSSEELTLKFRVDLSRYRLKNLIELKSIIADILGIRVSALRLLSVEEGCMLVTFLIPLPVAQLIFPSGSALTEQQMKSFRRLLALWLKCCGFTISFGNTLSENVVRSVQAKSIPLMIKARLV